MINFGVNAIDFGVNVIKFMGMGDLFACFSQYIYRINKLWWWWNRLVT